MSNWTEDDYMDPEDERKAELIEAVARAICLTQGEDPDTLDGLRICDANNRPMPLWNWYIEQADAAISVLLKCRSDLT